MNDEVRNSLLKLFLENKDLDNNGLVKAVKARISSDIYTGHAREVIRTSNLIILEISKFSKYSNTYRYHELWIFNRDLENNQWTLNRIRI